jgi:hypothetical protein
MGDFNPAQDRLQDVQELVMLVWDDQDGIIEDIPFVVNYYWEILFSGSNPEIAKQAAANHFQALVERRLEKKLLPKKKVRK